jgi:hypothetical protein
MAIVEAPVSQWYARRARLAFVGVGAVSGVVAAAVVAVFAPLPVSVVLGVLAGAVCGLVAGVLVRAWPVLRALWWWSFEITAAVLVVVGPSLLARVTAPWLALVAVLVAASVCFVVRPVRRFLSVWSWCVVDRHRLRLCFARIVRGSAGVGVRPGLLPLVLWARPTPAGERVWLWLRPGLELADLDGKAGQIAVAMPAKQVRVVAASERYAALIRVDISRRDPLVGRIDSPLVLLIPSLRNNSQKKAGVPISPVPPVGLDLADIPEPAPESPSRGGRR